jgi:hypothetical protein
MNPLTTRIASLLDPKPAPAAASAAPPALVDSAPASQALQSSAAALQPPPAPATKTASKPTERPHVAPRTVRRTAVPQITLPDTADPLAPDSALTEGSIVTTPASASPPVAPRDSTRKS